MAEEKKSRKQIWWASTAIVAVAATALFIWWFVTNGVEPFQREVRVLAWVGYDEDDLLSAFTADTGIGVRVRTAAGGDAVMAIFTAQPDEFDLVILDPEYIQKLAPAGRIRALDSGAFSWDGYSEQVRNHPALRVDGKLFGIPLRFGSNGLVFNTEHVSREQANTYEVLWSDEVQGRIGIWDWYLPSMGVISLLDGSRETPYRLNDTQFEKLINRLRTLRPRVRAIHAAPRDMLAALAAGDTWIVPAGGEWVAGLLRADGHPIDWTVPREGGIMWMETALIPTSAERVELATQFIRWMQSPRGQALLATRRAYYGVPCNAEAIPLLSPEVQDVLHVHSQEDLVELFGSLRTRELPQNQPPERWQDIWERFKSDSLD